MALTVGEKTLAKSIAKEHGAFFLGVASTAFVPGAHKLLWVTCILLIIGILFLLSGFYLTTRYVRKFYLNFASRQLRVGYMEGFLGFVGLGIALLTYGYPILVLPGAVFVVGAYVVLIMGIIRVRKAQNKTA